MPSGSEPVKNIVLVGRTGNGKSATGNSLVRQQKAFKSETQATGVTIQCQTFRAPTKNGPIINVIDTPGLFDLKVSAEFISKEIVRCLELAEEGLHAVVLVLSLRNRISKEEEDTLCKLQVLFGSKILDYLIIVFTGGDELEINKQKSETSQSNKKTILDKTPEQLLEDYFSNGCPEFLTRVLRLCGNRKVVFNNRTTNEIQKEKQVQQLLDNVAAVEQVNGGRPFRGGIHHTVKAEISRHMDQQSVVEAMHLARADIANMKQQLEKTHQNNLLQIAYMVEQIIKASSVAAAQERMLHEINDVRAKIEQNNRSCNIL